MKRRIVHNLYYAAKECSMGKVVWLQLVFFFAVLIFDAVRGYVEGMVMATRSDEGLSGNGFEGVRGHDLSRWYHYFCVTRTVLGMSIGVALVLLFQSVSLTPIFIASLFLFILFSSLVGWQVFESMYSFARYGTRIPAYENFLGLNIYVKTATAVWRRFALAGGTLILYVVLSFWR